MPLGSSRHAENAPSHEPFPSTGGAVLCQLVCYSKVLPFLGVVHPFLGVVTEAAGVPPSARRSVLNRGARHHIKPCDPTEMSKLLPRLLFRSMSNGNPDRDSDVTRGTLSCTSGRWKGKLSVQNLHDIFMSVVVATAVGQTPPAVFAQPTACAGCGKGVLAPISAPPIADQSVAEIRGQVTLDSHGIDFLQWPHEPIRELIQRGQGYHTVMGTTGKYWVRRELQAQCTSPRNSQGYQDEFNGQLAAHV